MLMRTSPSKRALSAVACGVGMFIAAATAAAAAPDTAGTRRALDAARESASGLRTEIAGTAAQIERLQAPVAVLDARLSDLQAQLRKRNRRLAGLERQLRLQESEIARLERELDEAEEQLLTRLVTVYKSGNPSLASAIVGADSVGEAMDRRDAAQRVVFGDQRLVRHVDALEARVRQARTETARVHTDARREAAKIRTARDELATTKSRLVQRQQVLSRALGARRGQLSTVEGTEALLEENLAALERASSRLEQTIAAAPALSSPAAAPAPAASAAAESVTSAAPAVPAVPSPPPVSSSSLVWPVSGSVVSPFGQRWGRLHSGIDIAAPSGTPIRAAASGRVIYAGWMDGYGNLVVVQHANGLSTAYGHQSRIGSSNGQSVGQGQTIGYVGCTGRCYGDHVHFETRANGSAVDPMPYL